MRLNVGYCAKWKLRDEFLMPTPHTAESARQMAERNRRILELVSQGVSVRQIAQQLRKTTTRVRQIIREAREANETQPTTGER